MNQQRIILTGHNIFEQVDKDYRKKLCVNCGGKGFYLLIEYGNHKGELIGCDCEKGFKYFKGGLNNNGKR